MVAPCTGPVFVDCPADTWTLVATCITTGTISEDSYAPNGYLQYYTPTTCPAPTVQTQGVPVFARSGAAEISAPAAIDVYIWAHKAAGRIRVDTP